MVTMYWYPTISKCGTKVPVMACGPVRVPIFICTNIWCASIVCILISDSSYGCTSINQGDDVPGEKSLFVVSVSMLFR